MNKQEFYPSTTPIAYFEPLAPRETSKDIILNSLVTHGSNVSKYTLVFSMDRITYIILWGLTLWSLTPGIKELQSLVR
ncbi:hypothetical protein OSB04_030270 [Centaurea solstitialis]|uniref:Uncharacterized protein n=1 Tax=Centaurea solstitialis TaxID=347529 RepID=A0AA38SQS5_9ASTR|nr:hypothetical protein OSB04_030270 [Centaurea solstitialis]